MAANSIDLQPYASLNDEDCDKRIIAAKKSLGDPVAYRQSNFSAEKDC